MLVVIMGVYCKLYFVMWGVFMFGRGVRLKRRGPVWLRNLDWFSVNMIVLFGVWVLCNVLILVCVRVFL